MVTIVGDVTGLQQRQRLSTEGKSFQNAATYEKQWRSSIKHQNPPFPNAFYVRGLKEALLNYD